MNLLHNVGLHVHPVFCNKFGMLLSVGLQIVALQAFADCAGCAVLTNFDNVSVL